MIRYLVALVLGTLLGVVCARYVLVNSAWSLVPWAVVALGLGWWSSNRKESLSVGAVYGFFLAYSFMLAGYNGSATVYSRLVPFVIFGLFGALCGAILAVIGAFVKQKLTK